MRPAALLTALVLIATPAVAAGPVFDPEAEAQAPALEAKWPPIDEPSYRASLLDFLVRHPSARLSGADRDIMGELSSSMGRFCNLAAPDRYGFVLSEFTTFANGDQVEARARQRLRRKCGLKIYGWERDGARTFVAVYGRPRGAQPTGQVHAATQGPHRLLVVALPLPAKPDARLSAAAAREAKRLGP